MTKNKADTNIYMGGLAEIVNKPTEITFHYLHKWFMGSTGYGLGLDLLGLQSNKEPISVLGLSNNLLVMNLDADEIIKYKNTIFRYSKQSEINADPKVVIDIKKALNPANLMNTNAIALRQVHWINKQQAVCEEYEKHIKQQELKISYGEKTLATVDQVDSKIQNDVIPLLIAVGYLAEFYNSVLKQKHSKKYLNIRHYIETNVAPQDWFVQAIKDMQKVKLHEITFTEYLAKYSLKSFNDYEILQPRWYEIPEELKLEIDKFPINLPEKGNIKQDEEARTEILNLKEPLIQTTITFNIYRSRVRKLMLYWVDKLRQQLLDNPTIVEQILKTTPVNLAQTTKTENTKAGRTNNSTGRGRPVSKGTVIGTILHISSASQDIPSGTIGIFPSSGVEFTNQYPKCAGIIFLQGGITSHGAIVAREFGIPAIVNQKCEGLVDAQIVEINGDSGTHTIKNN